MPNAIVNPPHCSLTVCSLIAVHKFPLILEIIYVKYIPPSLPWPWVSHHPVCFHISLLSHQTIMRIMDSNLFFFLLYSFLLLSTLCQCKDIHEHSFPQESKKEYLTAQVSYIIAFVNNYLHRIMTHQRILKILGLKYLVQIQIST